MKQSIVMIAITASAIMAGCNGQRSQLAAKASSLHIDTATHVHADTLAIDTYLFTHADSTTQVNIDIDYPMGNSGLAMEVKQFIIEKLNIPCYEDGDIEKKRTGYKGSLDDGHAVTHFYGNSYFKSMAESYKKESKDYPTPPFYYDVMIKKIEDNRKYITYSTGSYTYLGGAHGSYSKGGYNFRKTTGTLVITTIDTTKVKEMQPMLRHGIIKYFHDAGEKNVNKKNLNGWLLIDNDIIPLPSQQPYLTPRGLVFTYPEYEIAPYAVGIIEFTVPYKDVQKYMTREALTLINHK